MLVPPLKPGRFAALVTSTIVAVATSPALARSKAAAAVVAPAAPAPAPATSAEAIAAARVLLSALVEGRVDEARWNFDEALTASVSTEALRGQWQRVLSSYGPLLSSIDDVDITATELRVHVQLRHAAAVVGVEIAFDARLRVHELTFVPPSSSTWVPPLWVGAQQVRHINIGHGVLSVPVHGARHLPAMVLLVDEPAPESEAIRPFTEIQWGLASRGVVTMQLRAPHSADDVIAAVATVAARAEVDARRVVVVAHGRAAQVLPEVLARSANVAAVGVVSSSSSGTAGDVVARLAGQARPVLVVHAGRDATVTFADLDGWKQALVLKGNARFRVFPSLTHELRAMQDDGTQDPHVDVNVVELLADWAQQP
jgi:hypothetical protein